MKGAFLPENPCNHGFILQIRIICLIVLNANIHGGRPEDVLIMEALRPLSWVPVQAVCNSLSPFSV